MKFCEFQLHKPQVTPGGLLHGLCLNKNLRHSACLQQFSH